MNSFGREIPLVDLAGLTSAEAGAQTRMLATLRSAYETCGFTYLHNHGVAQPLIDAVFAQSRQFFSLPPELQNRAKPKEKGSTRGYEGVVCKRLKRAGPAILKKSSNAAPSRRACGQTRGLKICPSSVKPCWLFSTPPKRAAIN